MRPNLREVLLPFPAGLMATAQSPLALPPDRARDLTNMLAAPGGGGTKRGGTRAVGAPLPAPVTGLFSFLHQGTPQLLAATTEGKVYLQSGEDWQDVLTGLTPETVPHTVLFGGRLVLATGHDPLHLWDGTSFILVQQFVAEAGANLTRVTATRLTVSSQANLYPVGWPLEAEAADGTRTQLLITASSQSGATTTVDVAGPLPDPLAAVHFCVRPPQFGALAVAHDRLWGWAEGGMAATPGTGEGRLRVHYTHGVNDPHAWADPATGSLPSLNLADKAGLGDELLAMRVKDGLTVFMGRAHLQLWEGTSPGTAVTSGDFRWVKTIPLGLAHPRGVIDLPNDLLLLTPLGARTLARTVQTEQLDIAEVGNALDPTLLSALQQLRTSPAAFRALRSFSCPAQQWFGWNMAEATLVWQVTPAAQGWVVFGGDFAGLSAAHTTAQGELYLACPAGAGGQVLRYEPTVADDRGAAIFTRWWSPWLSPGNGRRWANKYLEVVAPAQAPQELQLARYTDLDDANPALRSLALPPPPDHWDSAHWDAAFFDNANPTPALVRDHTVAERVSLALSSQHTQPLTVLGLRLHGTPAQY